MVVDSLAEHAYQAEILIASLTRFAGADPASIVVQCTERVAAEIVDEFARLGCRTERIAPYLDGRYCNKIAQLDALANTTAEAAGTTPPDGGVFLLDLDVAVLAPLDIAHPDAVCGKIVDGANPPLASIESIFDRCGRARPDVVACDWPSAGDTVATNFNGGFLYIPNALLPRLRIEWRRWAERLFARPDYFEPAHTRKHTDQLSLALALAAGEFPVRALPANWNYPAHRAERPRSYRPDEPLRVLHYHDRLDEFGLIEPAESSVDAVAEAAQKVNELIGALPGSGAFEAFRRQRAEVEVARAPALPKNTFSKEFVARSWRKGGRRRRLLLHAGAPKTGTSSLQHHLAANRRALAEQGWWYPPPTDPLDPKHQELNSALRRGAPGDFAAYVEAALGAMPEITHTVVLSTEGIFNHWHDYQPQHKALLRHLAALFDFELCLWLRPPLEFAAALHAQYLQNPRTDDTPRAVHGRPVDFAEAMADRWFRRHLDYLGFVEEASALFGPGRVRVFLPDEAPGPADTVRTFLDVYRVPIAPPDSADTDQWRNRSLRRPGVELMQAVNAYAKPAGKQAQVVDLVRRIDAGLGDSAPPYSLAAREAAHGTAHEAAHGTAHGRAPEAAHEAALVSRCAERGWQRLRRRRPRACWLPADEIKPTLRKAFCIGLEGTGRREVAAALGLLGYRRSPTAAALAPDARLARVLTEAAEFDAFEGDAWSLLYRELDATFPGSRFILTVRPAHDWLACLPADIPDPELAVSRAAVYDHASPCGNELHYLARYAAHNERVVRYFGGGGDLLVMDVHNGAGWPELTEFLGHPSIEAPFPSQAGPIKA